MPGSKHGPNKLSTYREVHSTWMHRLMAEGFVRSDAVQLRPVGDDRFVLSGRTDCEGGIYVDVEKLLRVVDGEGASLRVETVKYSYNAALPGLGAILRAAEQCPVAVAKPRGRLRVRRSGGLWRLCRPCVTFLPRDFVPTSAHRYLHVPARVHTLRAGGA